MYDFCFTYPYAVLLMMGGLMGFITKGSTGSLMGGGGSGGVLFLLACVSLRYYRQGKLWKLGTFLSLAISSALAMFMFNRYRLSRKFFPGGLTMVVCGAMSLFYLWSLFFGPQPKKKASA